MKMNISKYNIIVFPKWHFFEDIWKDCANFNSNTCFFLLYYIILYLWNVLLRFWGNIYHSAQTPKAFPIFLVYIFIYLFILPTADFDQDKLIYNFVVKLENRSSDRDRRRWRRRRWGRRRTWRRRRRSRARRRIIIGHEGKNGTIMCQCTKDENDGRRTGGEGWRKGDGRKKTRLRWKNRIGKRRKRKLEEKFEEEEEEEEEERKLRRRRGCNGQWRRLAQCSLPMLTANWWSLRASLKSKMKTKLWNLHCWIIRIFWWVLMHFFLDFDIHSIIQSKYKKY